MEHYNILVVDDDEAIRMMLGTHLRKLGYAVSTASDMTQAIERLENSFFDVVLTDVRMPGTDGLELLKWISRNRLETGVVMLSGSSDVKVAVRAMQLGALDYILKPFKLHEIAEMLGRAIGRKQ